MTATPETVDFRDPEWVAEKLNLDKNAVYRYLNDGLLPGMQLGRKWLISESSLAEFLMAEQRRQTQERRLAAEGFASWADGTRRAIEAARDEALRRKYDYIGTEHILWALATDSGNGAAAVLDRLSVDRSQLVAEIDGLIPPRTAPVPDAIGLTPRAKKAVELAAEEAARLSHSQLDCDHLLLGLIAEGENLSARLLTGLGVTLESARDRVIAIAEESSG